MLEKIPFDQMVAKLFKKDTMNPAGQSLMHAAIGISGEIAELYSCNNRLNLLEELGDLVFYIEAARQTANPYISVYAYQQYTLASVLPIMTQLAGDLLDVAKKQWVYSKAVESEKVHVLLDQLLDGTLFLGGLSNYTILDIKAANQEKLATRYPDLVYSDQHAQARLDKQGE